MNQPGFYVYYDQIDILSSLNDEQFGRIIRAQAEYSRNGEITDFSGDGQMQMAFQVAKNKTDLFQANSNLKSEQQSLRGFLKNHNDSETANLLKYLLEESKRYKNVEQFRNDHSTEYRKLNELLTGQIKEPGYELPTDFEPDYIPEPEDEPYTPTDEEQAEMMRSYHEGLHEGIAGIIKRF